MRFVIFCICTFLFSNILSQDNETKLSKFSYQQLDSAIKQLYTQGNYHLALQYAEFEKQRAMKELGEMDTTYSNSLYNVGYIHQAIGNFVEAKKIYREAIRILAKTLGKKHPKYAAVLHQLGFLFMQEGNYAQAEKMFMWSNQIIANKLGLDHTSYAIGLCDLALLYYI